MERTISPRSPSALRSAPVAKKPDLLKDGFPFEPGAWMIVLEPLAPREETESGVIIVKQAQVAERYQTTVGRVLKVGPTALEGKTAGGIELSKFHPDIKNGADLIGRYVMYQMHSGQRLTLKATEQSILVVDINNILGLTDDPHAWRFYME